MKEEKQETPGLDELNGQKIFTSEIMEAPALNDEENIPSANLKDLDPNSLELIDIGGMACYCYTTDTDVKYFTTNGKEFQDLESLKDEFELNIKSISAEEMLQPKENEDSENAERVDVISEIVQILKPYIYLPDSRMYILLALYTILTYCFQLFSRIPYLALRGSKGSGKTTIMNLLSLLVRQPKLTTNLTPAALFRTIEEIKPSLFVDEFEGFSTRTSGNSPIIQILNSGYLKGGAVPRVIKNKTVDFSTYCPKIIAGINGLPATTEDRCIKIVMEKSHKELLQFNSTLELQQSAQSIKNLILFEVNRSAGTILDYRAGKEKLEIPPSIINRDKDLWFPILILAKIFECGDSKYFEMMTSLSLHTIRARKEAEALQPENMAMAIIAEGIKLKTIEVVFENKSGKLVKAKSVYELIEKKDEFNSYSKQAELTNILKKVGVQALRRRVGGKLTPLYKLPTAI